MYINRINEFKVILAFYIIFIWKINLYVLPYGQMSLWGATVITNLMSAIPWIGQDIVEFIWGGFSVNNATLNRFFSLHFVLPFVLAALALMHLILLCHVIQLDALTLVQLRQKVKQNVKKKIYLK